MSQLEMVIQEIDLLDENDLRILLQEISKRLEKKRRAISALQKFRGKGVGVWGEDAQAIVNHLRQNDRL